jgi:hypothetical protein
MKPPKIVIPIDLVDVLECVYKLSYGNKYIIVMAKSMYRSVWSINSDIERYDKGVRENTSDGLYGKFCRYIIDNPNNKFHFEMLLISKNPYKLLQCCQKQLDKSINDSNCLNTSFEPYLSRNIQTPPLYLKGKAKEEKYWINRGYYLNFRKWQINRHLRAI